MSVAAGKTRVRFVLTRIPPDLSEATRMAQAPDTTVTTELGALLREHQESTRLGRELIRLAVCARSAHQTKYAVAAERAAHDCIERALQLEARLRLEL